MPSQIITFKDTFMAAVGSGFSSFMQFIPALLGALVVLAIGWLISGVVAGVLERLLLAVRFEHVTGRIGLTEQLQRVFGSHFTATHICGLMAKWFIRLIFIQAAANILGMPQVIAIINSIILFIPNLFVALVILVVGGVCAQIIGRVVEASVTQTGVLRPRVFSLIARYAILGFATIAAINQLGIATNLLNILFTGLVGSISLALGLAFGLGGQSVAQDVTRNWYEQSKSGGARLRAVDTETPVQNKRV